MIKPIWIAGAFVAGIVVGVAAVRMTAGVPADAAVVAQAAPAAQSRPAEIPDAPAAPLPQGVAPAVKSTPGGHIAPTVPPAPGTASVAPLAAPPAALGAGPAATLADGQNPFPPLPPDDGSAVAQPIDVGEPFRKSMAKLSAEGDTIADAHRALERETRDDAWSYQRESDIQSALIPETGAGNFKAHYVECRATLCEVRLSAQSENQSEALRAWADGLSKQPWASGLFPTYSMSITKNGTTDRVIILRRPRK